MAKVDIKQEYWIVPVHSEDNLRLGISGETRRLLVWHCHQSYLSYKWETGTATARLVGQKVQRTVPMGGSMNRWSD